MACCVCSVFVLRLLVPLLGILFATDCCSWDLWQGKGEAPSPSPPSSSVDHYSGSAKDPLLLCVVIPVFGGHGGRSPDSLPSWPDGILDFL